MSTDLVLRYTLHPDGAHLVQVLGDTPSPILPDAVDGVPITQIGAYAFGQNPARIKPEGEVHTCVIGSPAAQEPLCGRALQAVHLPAGVEIIQNAAFFDCRNLAQLSVGPAIRAMGSDVFTNCFKMSLLKMRAHPSRPTGLKRLLLLLQNDLRVLFVEGETILAALRYPEYWEELEENAPAHILNMSIHGQGYQYRQCFSPDALNFVEYDRAFHASLAEGSHTLLGLLALDRMRWPFEMRPEGREEYLSFLKKEGELPGKALILEDDTDGLAFLCGLKVLDEAALNRLISFAGEKEKAAALALLMDHKHRTFGRAKKNYSFDF